MSDATAVLDVGGGIPGDPAAVEAAAATLRSAAADFTDTADAIGTHRRALSAEWTGTASDAAADALDLLSTRTRVGHDVAASAASVLAQYAGALRTAQSDDTAAANAAASAATAQISARTDLTTAQAQVGATTAAGQPAGTPSRATAAALSSATAALSAADQAASSAADAASDALALAAAADAQAAAAIDALTAQLSAMSGVSTSGSAASAAEPPAHHAGRHGGGWLHDAWSWTQDHADDISAVAGTAAFVTAFIPGVDVIATPLLTGVAVTAGGIATAHDVQEGHNGRAVQDGAFTILNAVPGLGAVKALSKLDDAGRLLTSADKFERTGLTIGEGTAITGPVYVKAPPNATAEEIASARAYTEGANKAAEAGALSSTGRVPTGGPLRDQAAKAIKVERQRALDAGAPYEGHVGHVPDTTWTATPEPHSWLDMPGRVNTSIGGQANGYPLGYQPTEFIFVEPGD